MFEEEVRELNKQIGEELKKQEQSQIIKPVSNVQGLK
jgi:hypothetical protein